MEKDAEWIRAYADHPNRTGYEELIDGAKNAIALSPNSSIVIHLRNEENIPRQLIFRPNVKNELGLWHLEILYRNPANGQVTSFGHINNKAILYPSNNIRSAGTIMKRKVWEILSALRDNFAQAITNFGKESSYCALCNRELTDTESIRRGVGPVCAQRWGIDKTPMLDLREF